jgi:hypothetical protein
MDEMDRERLDAVVSALIERLEGDWLLLGGALAALWLEARRTTEDVDLVGLGGTPEERLQVMELAEEVGLPIEALNSAADFFVRRISGWREEIELFRTGPRARLFRPTPTLFLLLKIGRLSEQDLADCRSLIQKAQREGLQIDHTRVMAALDALPPSEDATLLERRQAIRGALLESRP